MIEGLKNIALKEVVRAAGVELRQSGNRHLGLCPIHREKTPSFFVFPNNRWRCFGCNEGGDAVDFTQKVYGLDFKGALEHLGINQGPLTADVRRRIRERKRRTELVQRFRKWEVRYSGYLGRMIVETERLMSGITLEDLDLYAPLIDGLPVWEYHLEILTTGTDTVKYRLYKEATNGRRRI